MKFMDPYRSLYTNKVFDFYGRNVRMLEEEQEIFLKQEQVKEVHQNLLQMEN